MHSEHAIFASDAGERLATIRDPFDLIITSPPYPMIAMWDETFRDPSGAVAAALAAGDGDAAWESMHAQLDVVWRECVRLLAPGGFLCINVGDATRSTARGFRLFPNHARISRAVTDLGLLRLPGVIWRKSTNAPTKFMGSGMLPGGAYLTLEHEHILVFRSAGVRRFDGAERDRRRRSAYFWEERNRWFSDLWQVAGARQRVSDPGAGARSRSAAFPLEIPYRLIQMYSLLGDRVLDPFAGTGTTALAALRSARSSVSVERDDALAARIAPRLESAEATGIARDRLAAHVAYLEERAARGQPEPIHRNTAYGFPVVTSQEVDLVLPSGGTQTGRAGDGDAVHLAYRHDFQEFAPGV